MPWTYSELFAEADRRQRRDVGLAFAVLVAGGVSIAEAQITARGLTSLTMTASADPAPQLVSANWLEGILHAISGVPLPPTALPERHRPPSGLDQQGDAMTRADTEEVDYAHAVLVIDSVIGECADVDDLITKCLTAIGRVLPDLADDQQPRVLAAVQVISRHWIDSAPPRSGAGVQPDALRRALVNEHAVWANDDNDSCPHQRQELDAK
jgi:hypothetical protein